MDHTAFEYFSGGQQRRIAVGDQPSAGRSIEIGRTRAVHAKPTVVPALRA